MINITDETLNRYLDAELNRDENLLVKSAIEKSPELQRKYAALFEANNLLKNTKPDLPGMDFTKMAMQKINRKTSAIQQQKYFLLAILSFFTVIALGITGYLLFQVLSSAQSSNTNEVVATYSKNIGNYFSNIFGKQSLSIFGSILSFIMLVSGYFLYDYQKHSKKNFGH